MTTSKPPIVQPTRALPFDQLPWDDFERLCLRLLPREGFDNPQHYGAGGGEQGRDIVALRNGQLWYVQCKQVRRCGPKVLLNEIEKIQKLMENNPDLHPAGWLFIASCDVHATARDRASKRCTELGLECEVWGRTDLDARVQSHPGIVGTFFGWYARPIGIPFQAGLLPPHFVPRPEVSINLKVQLVADETTASGTLVISAIHGMGGIGKTTLVDYLTRDPEVQARFPDGILRVTLTQQPDVLLLLADWIQALGDYSFHPMVVESASAHLRTLLHDKACLLVVDDAWQADTVRPFMVGGEHCRVLVTTRDATLAPKVGARPYELDVMTEAQALALFEARLRKPLGGDRTQAAALARELGYLPLALELAAAQVEGGATWAELLAAFRKGLADLAVLDLDEATYRNESLRLSFRLSLEQLSAEDQGAFAWVGVLPEDARLNPAMAATLWEQPEADASKRLCRLRNKSLLKSESEDCYTVHDLLHDEAKLRLVERMPLLEAHAALLARYRQKAPDERWDRLSDDGYIHEHLTWHMEQAGQAEVIHTLLRLETQEGRNAWHEAREALRQTTGYIADIKRAWRLASQDAGNQALALQCRYALIQASLKSLAMNIRELLLLALIEAGLLTPLQGLAYARQTSHPEQRAEALQELAQLPALGNARGEILVEALTAAREIPNGEIRGRELFFLAFLLPTDLQRQVWAEALAVVRAIEWVQGRAQALARLASFLPFLPTDLIAEALTIAQEISASECRSLALTALIPHIPAELRPQALFAAWQIQDYKVRGRTLAELVLYVDPPADLLTKTVADLQGVESEEELSWMLVGLAGSLPPELLIKALAAARGFTDAGARARALMALCPHLPVEQQTEIWTEALNATRMIAYEHQRSYMLAELAPHLPSELLSQALVVAQEIQDPSDRSRALTDLVAYLPADQRPRVWTEALAAAREVELTESRARAIAMLASHLPAEQQSQVWTEMLAIVRKIDDEGARLRALLEWTPNMPAGVMPEALGVALEIRDDHARSITLAELVPELADVGCYDEALDAAYEVGWVADYRSRALATIVPKLAKAGRYQDALAAAREAEDASCRSQALAWLVPQLPTAMLNEVWEVAREIRDEDARSEAVMALAPKLAKVNRCYEALAVTQTIESQRERSKALMEMAPYLTDDPLTEAVKVARRIDWDWCRSRALAVLAFHLPSNQRCQAWDEALAAAQNVYPGSRDWILAELVSRAPVPSRYSQALGIAQDLDRDHRDEALTELALRMAEAGCFDEALAVVRDIEDSRDRDNALTNLALRMVDVGCFDEAFAIIQGVENGAHRIDALPRLASHLPTDVQDQVWDEILVITSRIEDESSRSRVLVKLATHWPPRLLSEVLATAWTIENSCTRCKTLIGLAPHLPSDQQPQVWAEALAIAGESGEQEQLCQALAGIAPHLSVDQQTQVRAEALAVAQGIKEPDKRAFTLISLAPHLPADQRTQVCAEALNIATTIDEQFRRNETLEELVSRLGQIGCYYEALVGASRFDVDEYRHKALADMASHWATRIEQDCTAGHKIWQEAFPLLADCSRPTLLRSLAALASVILALGGEEAVSEIIQAIQDVSRWWP